MSDVVSEAARKLSRLDGHDFITFASFGHEAKAADTAVRATRSWEWLSAHCRPQFDRPPLLVLAADDWNEFAPMPVYGMPQAWSDRLVVAATSGDLWDGFTGELKSRLDGAQRARLHETYGTPPDIGSGFADLAVAHEVAHFFHRFDDDSGWTDFARLWIAELFANVALYGYVSDVEPDQLPTLEVICELSAAAPTAWAEFGIDELGGGSAEGYIWWQLLLIAIARAIWRARSDALTYFRQNLCEPTLTDAQIKDAFAALDSDVARMIERWPRIAF